MYEIDIILFLNTGISNYIVFIKNLWVLGFLLVGRRKETQNLSFRNLVVEFRKNIPFQNSD